MTDVERLVAGLGVLEVGRHALRIAAFEHRLEHRRAEAATLLVGVRSDVREVEVRFAEVDPLHDRQRLEHPRDAPAEHPCERRQRAERLDRRPLPVVDAVPDRDAAVAVGDEQFGLLLAQLPVDHSSGNRRRPGPAKSGGRGSSQTKIGSSTNAAASVAAAASTRAGLIRPTSLMVPRRYRRRRCRMSGRRRSLRWRAVPDAIFTDPRLVEIYDDLDADRRDLDHYVAMIDEFEARSVLDLGCGTGVLACRLRRRGST